MKVFLLFPHQLFQDITPLREADAVYLIEELLFFRQYAFHKQKLILHRASMQYYEDYLRRESLKVEYIDAFDDWQDTRQLLPELANRGVQQISCYDVCDQWLQERLERGSRETGITLHELDTPLFLNTRQDLNDYFGGKNKFFQTDFYIRQRKKHRILVDKQWQPDGGQWSFDTDNRLRYPKGRKAPAVQFPALSKWHREAMAWVEEHFPDNPGEISADLIYPVTHGESEAWLQQFFTKRFAEFGPYEDAIVAEESVLHHSLLSPQLNIVLLLPMQVIQAALKYAGQHAVPLNSLEGFIRQILGWREFVRGVYVFKGTSLRNSNAWQCSNPMPAAFYTAGTGLEPVDDAIRKLLRTGYNHHIERLMLLGNLMLLSEIHPHAVYRWFMELYIDAYDWVMVPNVYGMSQCAAIGLMTTKPYISGSAYVLKMSLYRKGDWCEVWDALFWHFMQKHRNVVKANPRLNMLLGTYDRMSADRKETIGSIHEAYAGRMFPKP